MIFTSSTTPISVPSLGDGTGLYECMVEAKKQGKIRFIGITNHRLPIAREAVESGLYDTLQFPFSYLASEEDKALVQLCRDKQVGFICMKGLSGGLITRSDAAYAYLMQFDNALPIWGMQRQRELDEFLRYQTEKPVLNDEMRALIEKDRRELAGEFCRGCGYCLPCAAGIDIPTAARMSLLLRRSPSAAHLTPEAQEKNDAHRKLCALRPLHQPLPVWAGYTGVAFAQFGRLQNVFNKVNSRERAC